MGGQLYLGHGPYQALASDALGGPLLGAAERLLQAIADLKELGERP